MCTVFVFAKVIKLLQVLETITFLLFGISFGILYKVIYKCEKVLLFFKVLRHEKPN